MAKITVSIPIYISDELLAEFTEKTVESIKSKHDVEIVIIDNYCMSEFLPRMKKLGTYYKNDENCLPKAWNIGIKHGLNNNSDYIIIPNNDLIFHPEAIDNLVKGAAGQAVQNMNIMFNLKEDMGLDSIPIFPI